MHDLGLIDALRSHHPTDKDFSFYSMVHNTYSRIDLILRSRSVSFRNGRNYQKSPKRSWLTPNITHLCSSVYFTVCISPHIGYKKINASTPSKCPRCSAVKGNIIHMFWKCTHLSCYWNNIQTYMSEITRISILGDLEMLEESNYDEKETNTLNNDSSKNNYVA